MRFNDITLEGLMKEFKKISEAQQPTSNSSDYVLPKDLLDFEAAPADVPYYEDLMQRTASERSKLYGVVADSHILDEAHPKGSAKLEGLKDSEALVEDLPALRQKMEQVVYSKVSVKQAALRKKLSKLASDLAASGHSALAEQVNAQVAKLESFAKELTDTITAQPPQEIVMDEANIKVTPAPKAPDAKGMQQVNSIIDIFDQRLYDLLGEAHYSGTQRNSFKALDKTLRKYFNLYPSNVTSLPPGAKTYKNWAELAALVATGMNEWEALNKSIEMGGETLQGKLGDIQPVALTPDALRKTLQHAPPGAGLQGKPDALTRPSVPLSQHFGPKGPNQ